jgi:HK97 family phage major capsid protein
MNPLLSKLQSLNEQRDALMAKVDTTEAADLPALSADIAKIDAAIEAVQKMQTAQTTTPRTTPATVHDNRQDKPFASFGEFLQSVRSAAMSPSGIDPRLNPRAAALGANEQIGSEGGFLVGKDVAGEILQTAHDVGLLYPKCSPITISSNANAVTINGVDETSRATGSRWGGVQIYHAAEAATATAAKPKFRPIEMKLKKLLGFFYATDEVLQDAAALGSVAQQAFAEEFAFVLDDVVVRGNGAGQGLGLLNAGATVSVAKETGQPNGTFVAENVSKMWQRMLPRARARAVWYINSEVEPQLDSLNIGVGTSGQLVYLPAGGLKDSPTPMLKGRPVVTIEQASALGTVGDVILADLGYMYYASKGAMEQAESMHVQFLTGENTFRFSLRYDMQPSLASAITPYKGSGTQSPFVTLAAR